MLSKEIRILEFDESVSAQKKLIQHYNPKIVDLTALGPRVRLWMDKKGAIKVRQALDPTLKNSITFLGSGDFHHISIPLIEQFEQPLSVIVFDHHPDWFVSPPALGCGSWVSEVLKRKNIKKLVSLGPSSDDLNNSSMFTADTASFKGNRLEIYPYQRSLTRAFLKKIPDNISFKRKRTLFYDEICWQQLKDKNLEVFLVSLIERLPTKQVYISIDKDCLKKQYSLTNWEEGNFSLDELLLMLKAIKGRLDIVGLDITGDYSFPKVSGMIRSFVSRQDHPQEYSAKGMDLELVTSLNEDTNIKILELF